MLSECNLGALIMTDFKHLHIESARIRIAMQSKLNDADKANLRSESLFRVGDFQRASIESERANKFYKEALQLEHEAMDCDTKASSLESKIIEIEKLENELQEKTRVQMMELERQKRALRGS